jgi:hypothetical protein
VWGTRPFFKGSGMRRAEPGFDAELKIPVRTDGVDENEAAAWLLRFGWRKVDYLLAISTFVPAFAGPWANSRSLLCLAGDKAIPSLPAAPQISARTYWLPE